MGAIAQLMHMMELAYCAKGATNDQPEVALIRISTAVCEDSKEYCTG